MEQTLVYKFQKKPVQVVQVVQTLEKSTFQFFKSRTESRTELKKVVHSLEYLQHFDTFNISYLNQIDTILCSAIKLKISSI